MPQNPSPQLSPPIVLTFAASDPTGGAGVQADILTLASMGCHPLSVVTALTVQDTSGIEDVLPIEAGWIADQARALLEDIPVAAFKLGLLGSVEAIAAIESRERAKEQERLQAEQQRQMQQLGMQMAAQMFGVGSNALPVAPVNVQVQAITVP